MSSQKRNKKSKKGGEFTKSPTTDSGNIHNTKSIKSDEMIEIENLKKENELFKKENELLKKENEILKEKIAEILGGNEQLKKNHKLDEVTEINVSIDNGAPVMEVEHTSIIDDGQTVINDAQGMLTSSGNQQTDVDITNDGCLQSSWFEHDTDFTTSRFCGDRSESGPSKVEKSWNYDTENEQDNAYGYTEIESERPLEHDYNVQCRGETWKNQKTDSQYTRQKPKSSWDKKNKTFHNNDRENEQYGRRARNGYETRHEVANQADGNRSVHCEQNFRQNYSVVRTAANENQRYDGPGSRGNRVEQRGINDRMFFNNNRRADGNKERYNRDKEQFAKATLTEINGDLFTAPEDTSLAHCVAADLRMGSGIAVQFKQQFKNVDELLGQRKKVGEVAVLENKGRYIYYLITKKYSTGKPTLYDLRDSLEDMKKHVVKNNVKNIAVPRLGCGLDRLSWKDVRRMLLEVFADVDLTITVYNFTMDMQNSQDLPTKKSSIYIADHLMRLVNIERETLLILFGSECGFVDNTMQEVNEKFKFVHDYKAMAKNLGEVIELTKYNEKICVLIVKKHRNDLMSYQALHNCFIKLRKIFREHKFVYMGLSAFVDGDDDLTVAKVVTLLKVVFGNTYCETWVCWPDEMKKMYTEYRQGI